MLELHLVKSCKQYMQNFGKDFNPYKEKKAIAFCDSVFMLMSLRFTVSDTNGQERKHWTNCASSLKTSPSPKHPCHWG